MDGPLLREAQEFAQGFREALQAAQALELPPLARVPHYVSRRDPGHAIAQKVGDTLRDLRLLVVSRLEARRKW